MFANNDARKSRLLADMSVPVESHVGERMMRLMGWRGGALGPSEEGITEPLMPCLHLARGAGLGHSKRGETQTISEFCCHFLSSVLSFLRSCERQTTLEYTESLEGPKVYFVYRAIENMKRRISSGLYRDDERRLLEEVFAEMEKQNMQVDGGMWSPDNRQIVLIKIPLTVPSAKQKKKKKPTPLNRQIIQKLSNTHTTTETVTEQHLNTIREHFHLDSKVDTPKLATHLTKRVMFLTKLLYFSKMDAEERCYLVHFQFSSKPLKTFVSAVLMDLNKKASICYTLRSDIEHVIYDRIRKEAPQECCFNCVFQKRKFILQKRFTNSASDLLPPKSTDLKNTIICHNNKVISCNELINDDDDDDVILVENKDEFVVISDDEGHEMEVEEVDCVKVNSDLQTEYPNMPETKAVDLKNKGSPDDSLMSTELLQDPSSSLENSKKPVEAINLNNDLKVKVNTDPQTEYPNMFEMEAKDLNNSLMSTEFSQDPNTIHDNSKKPEIEAINLNNDLKVKVNTDPQTEYSNTPEIEGIGLKNKDSLGDSFISMEFSQDPKENTDLQTEYSNMPEIQTIVLKNMDSLKSIEFLKDPSTSHENSKKPEVEAMNMRNDESLDDSLIPINFKVQENADLQTVYSKMPEIEVIDLKNKDLLDDSLIFVQFSQDPSISHENSKKPEVEAINMKNDESLDDSLIPINLKVQEIADLQTEYSKMPEIEVIDLKNKDLLDDSLIFVQFSKDPNTSHENSKKPEVEAINMKNDKSLDDSLIPINLKVQENADLQTEYSKMPKIEVIDLKNKDLLDDSLLFVQFSQDPSTSHENSKKPEVEAINLKNEDFLDDSLTSINLKVNTVLETEYSIVPEIETIDLKSEDLLISEQFSQDAITSHENSKKAEVEAINLKNDDSLDSLTSINFSQDMSASCYYSSKVAENKPNLLGNDCMQQKNHNFVDALDCGINEKQTADKSSEILQTFKNQNTTEIMRSKKNGEILNSLQLINKDNIKESSESSTNAEPLNKSIDNSQLSTKDDHYGIESFCSKQKATDEFQNRGKRSRSASTASEPESSSKRCKSQIRSVRITCKDGNNDFNTDFIRKVQSVISESIDIIIDNVDFHPRLECHGVKNGGLIYSCHDDKTFSWLTNVVVSDLDLNVTETDYPNETYKMELRIYSFDDVEKILGRLKMYNQGLDTSLWRVIDKTELGDLFIITVEIDKDSFNYVHKNNYSLFAGVDKAKFNVIQSSKKF